MALPLSSRNKINSFFCTGEQNECDWKRGRWGRVQVRPSFHRSKEAKSCFCVPSFEPWVKAWMGDNNAFSTPDAKGLFEGHPVSHQIPKESFDKRSVSALGKPLLIWSLSSQLDDIQAMRIHTSFFCWSLSRLRRFLFNPPTPSTYLAKLLLYAPMRFSSDSCLHSSVYPGSMVFPCDRGCESLLWNLMTRSHLLSPTLRFR